MSSHLGVLLHRLEENRNDPNKVPSSLEKSQLKYQLKRTFALYINIICDHIVITDYQYIHIAFNLYVDACLEYLRYCDSASIEIHFVHASALNKPKVIYIYSYIMHIICSSVHKHSNYSIKMKSNTK